MAFEQSTALYIGMDAFNEVRLRPGESQKPGYFIQRIELDARVEGPLQIQWNAFYQVDVVTEGTGAAKRSVPVVGRFTKLA